MLKPEIELKNELSLSQKEVELFKKLLEAIYKNLEISEILNILANGIQEILQFKTVLISLYNETEGVFERKVQAGISPALFNELKGQKVPYGKIKMLLKQEFRVNNSYFISHTFFQKDKKLKGYIDKYGKNIEERRRKGKRKWNPDDVFLCPIKTRDGRLLGIVSVDNPVNGEFPSERTISLMESFSTYVSLAIENVRNLRDEKESLKRMNLIHSISKIIGQIFDLKTLYSEVIHIIRERFGYSNISIFEINTKGKPVLKSYSGYENLNIRKAVKDLRSTGLTSVVLKTSKILFVPNVQDEPLYIGDKSKPKSEAIIPLISKDKIVGLLDVEMEGEHSLGKTDLFTLSLLGEYIAMAMDNAHLYKETRRLAIKDEMTDTFNYRYFKEVLKSNIEGDSKIRPPFVLLMIDIDNFKKFNDTYGHLEGDRILKRVSKLIKRNVRRKDIVTRYGGDEFVIILQDIGKGTAEILGERIIEAVKRELCGFDFPLTLSIGMSSYPEDGKKMGVLIDKVDKALYRAKTKGRDRISV